MIDVLETSKGKCHISHLGRKGRHVFLPNRFLHQAESLFKEFHTVTEILRITRTEYYADNIATATLIAENCLPVNEDIPPCPVNVEDYDYPFKTGIEHISIIGKEELERRIDEDGDVTSFSDENTDFNSSLLF